MVHRTSLLTVREEQHIDQILDEYKEQVLLLA